MCIRQLLGAELISFSYIHTYTQTFLRALLTENYVKMVNEAYRIHKNNK